MMPTIYLIAIWIIKLPVISTSKTDYCKIEPNRHFLCEEEIDYGKYCLENRELHPRNDDDRRLTLKALNEMRAGAANGKLQFGRPKFTAPLAGNMYELKWDEECEKAARNIAKYCSANHNLYRKMSNIFARFEAGLFFDLDFFSVNDNITSMSDHLWHKFKGDDYRFHDISVYEDPDKKIILEKYNSTIFAMKLSLLLRAELSVVGCSMVLQKNGPIINNSLACVFGGIITWGRPLHVYRNYPPCTMCPYGSKCSTSYPGLCDCEEDCYSYSNDVKGSGFYDSYAIVFDEETGEDEIVALEDLKHVTYKSTYRYWPNNYSNPRTSTSTHTTSFASSKNNLTQTHTSGAEEKISTTTVVTKQPQSLYAIKEFSATELSTMTEFPAMTEFPKMTEFPTNTISKHEVSKPEEFPITKLSTTTELSTTIHLSTSTQKLDIQHSDGYKEFDEQKNHQPVVVVTETAVSSIAFLPSIYSSPGTSLCNTVFLSLIMIVSNIFFTYKRNHFKLS